ncbi:MAG: acyltransferase [Candidatus Scalindua sp.]|jgi:acetyltransferase-like isoleucine patch superfamily enzyme|nr:acyltransferase [Candidatus Scalindua sp.]MBT5307314.1 acyltransferase [Candidatus Scalindua sp.]MBT6050954.1 acyltransferase [Candidatus Scalindua sp.]MBT6230006.1 acyltransferase [Candidatus Scalindua sp.]MBT6563162.1 acyltransferase [Candidatus Scalindua sp.]
MINKIRNILKGLALLRYPETIKVLGEIRLQRLILADIQARFPKAKLSDSIEWVGYESVLFKIGENSQVCQGTVLAFGDVENGFGKILIGDNTWIGQYNNLRSCADGHIRIGRDCLISQFCTLAGSNHSFNRNKLIREQGPDSSRLGVTLKDDVWLGSGVSVMPGVEIGEGCVIGANSVVTRAVPDYEIWAGCPARKIGERK